MDYSILVNKKNLLDASYIPKEMIFVPSVSEHLDSNHDIFLNQEAWTQFQKMNQDSPMSIYVDSGYRSFEYQQMLLDHFYQKDGEKCYEYVALPGTSEHQTGIALDFGFVNSETGKPVDEEVDQFPIAFQWILENAHQYGFILRYPKGKEQITGYRYEPWHLRYVGIEMATEIYHFKETLEEYTERKKDRAKRI